jgi:hypothetical protein
LIFLFQVLSHSPPSVQLQQCLSEVEAVKKLIQTHTPQAAVSDGSENVQKKIEDYVYQFLSDSSMQMQTEFVSKLSPLMMTAYSSGGVEGNQAYQLVSDIQNNVGDAIRTVQDRQNTYIRNRLNRVTPFAMNASSKDAHDFAVAQLTALNTEGENLCRKYHTQFASLMKIATELTKAFDDPMRTQSFTNIANSKGKFIYDKFDVQSDMPLYLYFSSLCYSITAELPATTIILRNKLDEGWQKIEQTFGAKVDEFNAKLIQDGDEKKALIAKYANVPEMQLNEWKRGVDGAVADGSKLLDGKKSLLKTVHGNSLIEFDKATNLMPELISDKYNTCGYDFNDASMVYSIIGFDTNLELNAIYEQLNQFTEAPPAPAA